MRTIRVQILLFFLGFFAPLKSQIKAVDIEGNHRTKSEIIYRELGYEPGLMLVSSDSLLEVWRLRLESTKLFNGVGVKINRAGDTLKIHLVERWYYWFQPEGGFADRNFNSWWKNRELNRVFGGGTVYANNVLGEQKGLFVHALAGYNQGLGIGLNMPFQKFKDCNAWKFSIDRFSNHEIWTNSIDNKVVFFQTSDRFVQQQTIAMAEYRRRFTYRWQGIVRLKYLSMNVSGALADINPAFLIGRFEGSIGGEGLTWKQTTNTLQLGWSRDTRNQTNYPTKGSEWKGGIAGGLQQSGNTSAPMGEFESKYRGFKPLTERTSLAVMGLFRLRLGHIAYAQQRQMGYGMEYVRGYESSVFDGAGLALAKVVWRYSLLGEGRSMFLRLLPKAYEKVPIRSWLNIFADVGRTLSPYNIEQNPMSKQTLMSVGLGLDVLCYYDALARLDMSYNPSVHRWVMNITFFHAI